EEKAAQASCLFHNSSVTDKMPALLLETPALPRFSRTKQNFPGLFQPRLSYCPVWPLPDEIGIISVGDWAHSQPDPLAERDIQR
ncbi:MAG: hypothetical protein VYC82_09515, partial [Verrucomicrobiota bacterium]|nr:hypothetical protein [Verrucomicrobiota bacterium]